MVFRNNLVKENLIKNDKIQLHVNGPEFRILSRKNLGLIVDNKSRFTEHVTFLIKKKTYT